MSHRETRRPTSCRPNSTSPDRTDLHPIARAHCPTRPTTTPRGGERGRAPDPRRARAPAHPRAPPPGPVGGPRGVFISTRPRTFGVPLRGLFCYERTRGCAFRVDICRVCPQPVSMWCSCSVAVCVVLVCSASLRSSVALRTSCSRLNPCCPGRPHPFPPKLIRGSTRQIRCHYQKAFIQTAHIASTSPPGPELPRWATSVVLGSQDVSPVVTGLVAATDSVTARSRSVRW